MHIKPIEAQPSSWIHPTVIARKALVENYELLSFGRCQLNLAARELSVDSELIDLQPLVFDLLAYMVQNPNRVIGKDELLNAVWRSPFVTDSVVTRAVMKTRRAIMDDAREPKILYTVQRKGYRLDAEVTRSGAKLETGESAQKPTLPVGAAFDLAVLPWIGSGTAPDGTALHLAFLLQHLLERTGQVSLLPMVDILAFRDELEKAPDTLDAVCTRLGTRAVVWCKLDKASGGLLELTMRHGARLEQAQAWHLRGTDACALALDAARALLVDAGDHPYGPVHAAALLQLGEAIYLERARSAAQAYQVMLLAHARLPLAAWTELVMARLEFKSSQTGPAMARLKAALSSREAADSPLLRLQLLSALGEVEAVGGELANSCACFEQAHELARQSAGMVYWRWVILGLWSVSALRIGQPEQARRLAAQSVLIAAGSGHVAGEGTARVLQGLTLTLLEQNERAAESIHKAVQLANQTRQPRLKSRALRCQSLLLMTMRKHAASIEAAREGVVQAQLSGEVFAASSCTANIYQALVTSDRLDEALQHHDEQLAEGFINAEHRRAFEVQTAILWWKLGRDQEAIAMMEQLTKRVSPQPTLHQRQNDLYLARIFVILGRLDEARALLERMEDDPARERPMALKADLALAMNDRAGCIEWLRQIWQNALHRTEEVVDACLDLAWLLLEDQAPGELNDEVESLVAHAMDYTGDCAPANLLVAAYFLRTTPGPANRARWMAAVRQARGFAKRFPDMASEAFCDLLVANQAPHAPLLLTRLCQ